jgi:carboxyl-terminal processing protease
LKLTDNGRRVYSGGGVEPDRRFDGPFEGFSPTRFGRTLAARQLFDTFSQRFSRRGDLRIAPSPTGQSREVGPEFEVDDAMMAEFRQHVEKSKLKIDEAAWKTDQNFIRAMIRYEIDLDLFGVAAARQNLSKLDPQLQFALTLFPEAQKLMEMQRTPTRRAQR